MPNVLSAAALPPALYEAVWRELPQSHNRRNTDETVLWVGQPDAARTITSSLPILFFGVPWTLFSLFWMAMAARSSFLFALFGLPFVLIGGVMLAAPWLAGNRDRQTVYVLTNRRILLITASAKATDVKTYVPQSDGDLERVERPDGSGNLIFERREGRDSDGDRTVQKVGFMGIPDVRRVEQILRDTFFTPHDLTKSDENYPVLAPSGTAAPWYSTYKSGQ